MVINPGLPRSPCCIHRRVAATLRETQRRTRMGMRTAIDSARTLNFS
ncbi:MAG: hypothetical protein V7K42_02670 [Nostoc sp.]